MYGYLGGVSCTSATECTAVGRCRYLVVLLWLSGGMGQDGRYDRAFSNVDYNGGPVMKSITNYVIYWSPSGSRPIRRLT
jgi:hypothetical protein